MLLLWDSYLAIIVEIPQKNDTKELKGAIVQRFHSFKLNFQMKSFDQYKEVLLKYTTPEIADYIVQTFSKFEYQFLISSPRSSKHGDYRPPYGNRNFHRISVNGNLNAYSFFITFLHELAHLKTWLKYKNKVKSHGNEWKIFYIELLEDSINRGYFPEDIVIALKDHLTKVKSSTSYDYNLIKILNLHDKTTDNDGLIEISTLDMGDLFIYKNRTFKVDKLLRKRICCWLLPENKKYSFSPLARVKGLSKNEKN